MLPGVSQVRPGPGHRQGVREPGFSSLLPLASEWSSGSLADEKKATFALGGRRDDWRRARWTGTISELEACWPGWPGGPGPGGGGREGIARWTSAGYLHQEGLRSRNRSISPRLAVVILIPAGHGRLLKNCWRRGGLLASAGIEAEETRHGMN